MHVIESIQYKLTLQLWREENKKERPISKIEYLFPAGLAPVIPSVGERYSTMAEGIVGDYRIRNATHQLWEPGNGRPNTWLHAIYMDAILIGTTDLTEPLSIGLK